MKREHQNLAVERASRGAPKWIITCVLLLCLLSGSSEANCDACPQYCCEGSRHYCCSFSVYLNTLLSSGPVVSFMMFAVLLAAAALGALILCVSVCMQNSQGARVADTLPDVNVVTQAHPGILPGSHPPGARTAPLRQQMDFMMMAPAGRQPPSYTPKHAPPNHYTMLPLYPTAPKKGTRPIPTITVTPPPIGAL